MQLLYGVFRVLCFMNHLKSYMGAYLHKNVSPAVGPSFITTPFTGPRAALLLGFLFKFFKFPVLR